MVFDSYKAQGSNLGVKIKLRRKTVTEVWVKKPREKTWKAKAKMKSHKVLLSG